MLQETSAEPRVNQPVPAMPRGDALLSHAPDRRIGELEVLRTVAVGMVLLQHINGNLIFWPSKIAFQLQQNGMWTGVDLFFAISGFVIARSLLPTLKGARDTRHFARLTAEFWIRRIWRLWPSSWFWLAAPLLLCLVFNRSGVYSSFHANWNMAVAGGLNLANFYFAYVSVHSLSIGTAFVQWSLSLEEQFYLLLPIAAFLLRRRLPYLLGAIFLYAFFAPTQFTTLDVVDTTIANMTRGGSVAAGVLLAVWSFHPGYQDFAPTGFARCRPARIAAFAGTIALLVSLGSSQFCIVPHYLGPIAILTAFLVWIASYNAGYLWRPGLSRTVMEILAARSYSLYLVHIPVYFAMHEIWFRLHGAADPSWRRAALYLALTPFALAVVTEANHRLLERPLRDYGKQVARRFAAHG